jgi:hypothetical protein
VTATTSDLIARRYAPHGQCFWLRPNLCEIVTEQQALAEIAEQIEPARKDDDVSD